MFTGKISSSSNDCLYSFSLGCLNILLRERANMYALALLSPERSMRAFDQTHSQLNYLLQKCTVTKTKYSKRIILNFRTRYNRQIDTITSQASSVKLRLNGRTRCISLPDDKNPINYIDLCAQFLSLEIYFLHINLQGVFLR